MPGAPFFIAATFFFFATLVLLCNAKHETMTADQGHSGSDEEQVKSDAHAAAEMNTVMRTAPVIKPAEAT